MKIFRLKTNPNLYSSNSFLVLGSWNKLDDVNTLVDTGSDDYILGDLKTINTGVGKNPVDKLILTHGHFDHIGGIKQIKNQYKAEVLANNKFEAVDRTIGHGDVLKLGDCYFEVIKCTGHSSDSICLYCKQDGVLFSGDTTLRINSFDASYSEEFLQVLERILKLDLKIIYPGHGDPMNEDVNKILAESLKMITKNKIQIKDNY